MFHKRCLSARQLRNQKTFVEGLLFNLTLFLRETFLFAITKSDMNDKKNRTWIARNLAGHTPIIQYREWLFQQKAIVYRDATVYL